MRYVKSSVFLPAMFFSALFFVWHLALAKPPLKSGNPGLPGCLAEVDVLQGQIAAKDAEIAQLEGEIADKDVLIAELQTEIEELNELVNQLLSQALVPQTGQITPYSTGDDGDLQMGVSWPAERFTDNNNGTITDNLTGLVWTESAGCGADKDWYQALTFCNQLEDGQCGLSDGSQPGDWHLPNANELQSLIDYSRYEPALPTGHPFTDVQWSSYYWTSTTRAKYPTMAWFVILYQGFLEADEKTRITSGAHAWCVRSGSQ